MAKKKESTKGFMLLELTAEETTKIGGLGICDHCNKGSACGTYIAVLNHWVCDSCFQEWHKCAKYYVSDIFAETFNYTTTLQKFKL